MQRSIPSRLISLVFILITQAIACFAQDKLSGTAAVSPTGAATYSVAIEAPKGRGDLMPSIGIAYNSQAGNGLVGFGCNITGLSVITRGTKTIAHDNTVKGIDYNSNSCALYLDGKRLLLKSGTEGTDGCVYAPEGEPLTNVTLHSSLTSNSCWFEVDTNDGMVYEFGYTSGRQFLSNYSAVAAWYISRATNPMGQTILYYYSADGLSLYPQTIYYGGDNTVNFTYESRTDSIFFALKDDRGYVGKRLKSISTKAGDSTFRTYTMSYNNSYDGSQTKFSRLTTIHETGENGSSSHDITAQWNYLPSFSATCQNIDISISQSHYDEEYLDSYMLSGDVTGDGWDDIIRISNVLVSMGYQNTLKTYIQVYRSFCQNGNIDYNDPIVYKVPGTIISDFTTCIVAGTVFGDLDGDGVKDIILPIYHENHMKFKFIFGRDILISNTNDIYESYSISCGSEIPLVTLTDLNNDGKVEILHLQKQENNGTYLCVLMFDDDGVGYTIPFYFSLSSTPQKIVTSDFNHDGLTDLMVISESGYRIFNNKGNRLLEYVFEDNSALNSSLSVHPRMEMGDFNGDGIADFIWNDNLSHDLNFEIGNADGTYTRYTAYQFPYYLRYKNNADGTWNCIVTDLDHDGKSDIVLNLAEYAPTGDDFRTTHTYWFISNGTSLELKKHATSTRMDDAKAGHFFAGDFRGQGFLEIGNYGYNCYNGNDANTDPTVNLYSNSYQNISNGKVSQFQDSNGRKTAFAYSSMTSDLVYTKGTGSCYPLIDVIAPLCVTSQVTESGGSPITTQTNYTYKALRSHLQGHGLLGFKEMTATEANSGKTVKTTVDSFDPTYYVPLHTTVTTSQGGYTTTMADSMALRTSVTSSNIPNKNYLLLPYTKTNTDIYNHPTVTTYTFNPTYHYLTKERTVYDNSYYMFRQTQYTYPSNKIAGAYRPTSAYYMQMHPDGSCPFEYETKFSYDSYGRKTSVTKYDGLMLALTTTYTYDIHGNVTKEKYSGYGISNDTETNYQYGSNGKFLTQKSNIAQTISYTRNAFGDITAETNLTNAANPLTTTYTRNAFGTLTREEKPTGEVTTWTKANTSEYGGSYCITSNTNYSPKVKTWYDALGNELRTETTGIGDGEISTTTTYNALGQVTAKANVHGNLTTTESYTYDGLGRMATYTSPDGVTETYAYDDREVSTTKNGRTYTKNYDAWGNVTQSDDPVSSVSYTYEALGKPSEVTTGNNTVEIEYDDCGNQITLDDPDAGTTTYEYDALHRIISQTDARGNVTTFSYDGAGRMTQKTVAGTTTTYSYVTSGNGAGQLGSVQTGDRTILYTYDDKGRVSQETRSMTGEPSMTFGYTYNSDGTLASKTYPQNVTIDYVYEGGHCIATKMGTTNICLTTLDDGFHKKWDVGGTLIFGDPNISPKSKGGDLIGLGDNAEVMGGGRYNPLDPNDPIPDWPIDTIPWGGQYPLEYMVYYAYLPVLKHRAEYDTRGYLTKLATQSDSLMFNFQSGTGNLLSRTGMTSQTEYFTYDNLERLTQASGSTTQAVSYYGNGNISSKTGPGTYTYSLSHAHAVSNVTNPSGSISSDTQTATYTPFGKVATLSEDDFTLTFTYGPDEERWKTVLQDDGNTIRTTIYADGYERITANGQTRHFYYLDGGVIYVLNDGATTGTFYYTFTDHLGSITQIYRRGGARVFSAEYDAWGKQTVSLDTLGFHRGYCGHEMMPNFGLINMNGRLYDPYLARFLSPDNYVQLPDFSQSFNRYSYCLNNPLKYTDPSGELFGIDDVFLIYSLISGAIMGAANASMNGDNAWTGALKGLVTSAISTIGTAGVGEILGHSLGSFGTELLRAGSHGILNGISSALNGGNFGTGFATAALSSLAGSGAQAMNFNSWGVVASTTSIGAITSCCLGGGFLEGAMTGLSIGAFNHNGDKKIGRDIIAHEDGTLEYTRPICELIVTPNHATCQPFLLLKYEKPLESFPIEMALLLPIRGIANGAIHFTKNGVSSLYNYFTDQTGGMKQWIRFGPSYSPSGHFPTNYSIRWGASYNYRRLIGNPTLRNLNSKIRGMKLPGNNWRVNDPGHLHIY